MLPLGAVDEEESEDFTIEEQPGLTYRIVGDRIIGRCDGLKAVKQAIYKILNTERYAHDIYSWNYGIELTELFGEHKSYLLPELETRITDALLTDDRIQSITDFVIDVIDGKSLHVQFVVNTKYGSADIEQGVNIDV